MSSCEVRHNPKPARPVQGQRGEVVFLHCEDELLAFKKRALQEQATHALPAHALRHTQPSDVKEAALIAAHEKVPYDGPFFLDDPSHSSTELVLEHSLRHGVREEEIFKKKNLRYIQSASCTQHLLKVTERIQR